MSIKDIVDLIDVAGTILAVIAVIITAFHNMKGVLTKLSVTFISDAELNKTISGVEKMRLVVSWLKNATPRLFRIVFTDEVLEKIAQNVFDDMRKYADRYIEEKRKESTGE